MINSIKYKVGLLIAGCFLLFCAAPGWNNYKAAMACHLGNGTNCDHLYEDAIRENPSLPGVYSSYASHLVAKGITGSRVSELYQREMALHPQSKKAIAVVLAAQSQKASKTPAATVADSSISIGVRADSATVRSANE